MAGGEYRREEMEYINADELTEYIREMMLGNDDENVKDALEEISLKISRMERLKTIKRNQYGNIDRQPTARFLKTHVRLNVVCSKWWKLHQPDCKRVDLIWHPAYEALEILIHDDGDYRLSTNGTQVEICALQFYKLVPDLDKRRLYNVELTPNGGYIKVARREQ